MEPVCPRTPLAALLAALFAAAGVAAPVVTGPEGAVRAVAGEAALLRYEVRWDPSDGALTVLPPEAPEVSWGRVYVHAVETGATGHTAVTLAAESDTPGRREIPAFRIRVGGAGHGLSGALAAVETTALEAPAAVAVFSAPWRVPGGTAPWAAGALACAAALALWWRRRHRAGASASAAQGAAEAARALLHDARRRRLDGDFYGYYKALARAAALAGAARLGGQLDEKTQSVGYRGVRPADEEMDGDLRAVERALAGQPGERHA